MRDYLIKPTKKSYKFVMVKKPTILFPTIKIPVTYDISIVKRWNWEAKYLFLEAIVIPVVGSLEGRSVTYHWEQDYGKKVPHFMGTTSQGCTIYALTDENGFTNEVLAFSVMVIIDGVKYADSIFVDMAVESYRKVYQGCIKYKFINVQLVGWYYSYFQLQQLDKNNQPLTEAIDYDIRFFIADYQLKYEHNVRSDKKGVLRFTFTAQFRDFKIKKGTQVLIEIYLSTTKEKVAFINYKAWDKKISEFMSFKDKQEVCTRTEIKEPEKIPLYPTGSESKEQLKKEILILKKELLKLDEEEWEEKLRAIATPFDQPIPFTWDIGDYREQIEEAIKKRTELLTGITYDISIKKEWMTWEERDLYLTAIVIPSKGILAEHSVTYHWEQEYGEELPHFTSTESKRCNAYYLKDAKFSSIKQGFKVTITIDGVKYNKSIVIDIAAEESKHKPVPKPPKPKPKPVPFSMTISRVRSGNSYKITGHVYDQRGNDLPNYEISAHGEWSDAFNNKKEDNLQSFDRLQQCTAMERDWDVHTNSNGIFTDIIIPGQHCMVDVTYTAGTVEKSIYGLMPIKLERTPPPTEPGRLIEEPIERKKIGPIGSPQSQSTTLSFSPKQLKVDCSHCYDILEKELKKDKDLIEKLKTSLTEKGELKKGVSNTLEIAVQSACPPGCILKFIKMKEKENQNKPN